LIGRPAVPRRLDAVTSIRFPVDENMGTRKTTNRDSIRADERPRRDSRGAARLATHEAVCAERYANLLSLLESTIVRVGRLEVLVVIVAGSVICGMGGIIFTLALKLGAH
jgi:hypothetical protein